MFTIYSFMRLSWKADGREAAGAGGFGRDLQIRLSLRPSDIQGMVFALVLFYFGCV